MYVYIVYTLLVAIVGMIICRSIFAWPGVTCYSVLGLYVCIINASTCSHYDFIFVCLLYSLRHAVICSYCVIHTWFCVYCVYLPFCMLKFSLVLFLKIRDDSQISQRSIIQFSLQSSSAPIRLLWKEILFISQRIKISETEPFCVRALT